MAKAVSDAPCGGQIVMSGDTLAAITSVDEFSNRVCQPDCRLALHCIVRVCHIQTIQITMQGSMKKVRGGRGWHEKLARASRSMARPSVRNARLSLRRCMLFLGAKVYSACKSWKPLQAGYEKPREPVSILHLGHHTVMKTWVANRAAFDSIGGVAMPLPSVPYHRLESYLRMSWGSDPSAVQCLDDIDSMTDAAKRARALKRFRVGGLAVVSIVRIQKLVAKRQARLREPRRSLGNNQNGFKMEQGVDLLTVVPWMLHRRAM